MLSVDPLDRNTIVQLNSKQKRNENFASNVV